MDEPDGGVPDAAADSGSDAAADSGSDGGALALCPQTDSWPVGTYWLKANVVDVLYTYPSLPPPRIGYRVISHARKLRALTITKPEDYSCLIVQVDELGPNGPLWLNCVNVVEYDTYISLRDFDTCVSGGSVLPGCNYLDIDRRTGAIIRMVYTDTRSTPAQARDFFLAGTGWPRCGATEASPPVVPDPPDDTHGSIPLGCTQGEALDEADPAPPCAPSQSVGCTCEAIQGGTLTTCCPP